MPPCHTFPSDPPPVSSPPADAQVQDFLLHSMSDMSNSSQGRWLQQTCTLFIQSGVQLLSEFTQHAAAWANTSLIRTNFSQPNHSVSQQLELAANSRGEEVIQLLVITGITLCNSTHAHAVHTKQQTSGASNEQVHIAENHADAM